MSVVLMAPLLQKSQRQVLSAIDKDPHGVCQNHRRFPYICIMRLKVSISIVLFSMAGWVAAQDAFRDSLLNVIFSAIHDTTKVNA